MRDYSKENRQLLQDIFRILVEEVNLYEGLAETVLNKQKAIVDNDIKLLKKYTVMEQSFVKKGNDLTNKRIERMPVDADKNQKGSLLTRFFKKYGLINDRDWSALESRLQIAISKIKRANLENSMLLKTSISFVQNLIKLYYPKKEKESGTYDREGKSHVEKAHVLDCGV